MGKKYIIELENDQIIDGHIACPMQIGYRDRPAFIIDTGIDITPYTEPDMEQVRKEAYDKGYDDATAEIGSDEQAIAEKAYQKGLSDAWDAARKIADMPYGEEEKVFGSGGWHFITQHTASEAIEKIRQYDQEKEEQIQVGDEIETPSGLKGYVVNFTDDELVHYVSSEGRFGTMGMSAVSKTGRHFPEIAKVLEKMRGVEKEKTVNGNI